MATPRGQKLLHAAPFWTSHYVALQLAVPLYPLLINRIGVSKMLP